MISAVSSVYYRAHWEELGKKAIGEKQSASVNSMNREKPMTTFT